MSLENYALHIAPRGGKVDLIVDAIMAQRSAAHDVRLAFAISKGAIGTYGTETGVSALVFAEGATLPDGYILITRIESGIVAAPKAKDRTKASRDATRTLKAQLSALPRMTGASEFTAQIGSSHVLGAHESGRGFALRACFFERVGDTTFVFTPWSNKQQVTGDSRDDANTMTAFHPEGCKEVGLSAYYLAKEKAAK